MNNQEPAVIVEKLHKSFKLPHERNSGIKSAVVNFSKRRKGYELQHVLKGISFEIQQGEFFGIVGRNGSGKSTLLKLLAGIYNPDKGGLKVNGSLVPFIELGVGFNPELTGRENVYLNGALLGFSHKEIAVMYDDIVEFAELGRFMDQRLKNYSSGMQVRLAFSIAIRARSDILLLDEVLAVGDAVFQHKCFDYFKELKRRKQTVIFISHDANILQEYCDRGILLEKGEIVSEGRIETVVKDYIDILNTQEAAQHDKIPEKSRRWGSGEIIVEAAETLAVDDKPKALFTEDDKEIKVSVTYKAEKDIDSPVYGIIIADSTGRRIFESNTIVTKTKTEKITAGERITVTWTVPNMFNTDRFMVSPAVANRTGDAIYDWHDELISFKIRKTTKNNGLLNVEHGLTILSVTNQVQSRKQ
jgi:ABC-2 type transport system ATP-binding protein